MKNLNLTTGRIALGLSVQEAAAHVGGVADRSWRRWEDGTHAVPDDVEQTMAQLLARRKASILDLTEKQHTARKKGENIKIDYHVSPSHFNGNVVEWRLSQSIAIELHYTYDAELIKTGD